MLRSKLECLFWMTLAAGAAGDGEGGGLEAERGDVVPRVRRQRGRRVRGQAAAVGAGRRRRRPGSLLYGRACQTTLATSSNVFGWRYTTCPASWAWQILPATSSKRILNPRSFIVVASYDVASNVCPGPS